MWYILTELCLYVSMCTECKITVCSYVHVYKYVCACVVSECVCVSVCMCMHVWVLRWASNLSPKWQLEFRT